MSTTFSYFFEKINQISPLESKFTEVLEHIALMPKTLYYYGKLPKNRPKTVAIVGSRHNTRYGQEVAYKLAYELARRGVIVVSGLAYGIDSIAHRGCLAAGGTTIAVLGTPVDQIYPRAHTRLAAEIIEKGGAVMSEYPPSGSAKAHSGAQISPQLASAAISGATPGDGSGTPDNLLPGEYISKTTGQRGINPRLSFLYRNRIISGLSDVVVVAEAALKSGSLNTASHALEQGKEVFAVPGNVTNPYSQGCNKLIAAGATPYTEPEDILRVLFPAQHNLKQRKLSEARLIGDTDTETAVLKALSAGARRGEDLMRLSLLPPEVFNQTITLLEIKSRVRSLGANQWALV